MLRGLLVLLWIAPLATAAPVPRERSPDPWAWAYMGVRVENGSMRVSSTDPGTPANKAGIMPGDLIIKVGNLKPQTFDDVALYVFCLRPGMTIVLEVRRNEELVQIPLVLGERPSDAPLPDAILRRMYNKAIPIDD